MQYAPGGRRKASLPGLSKPSSAVSLDRRHETHTKIVAPVALITDHRALSGRSSSAFRGRAGLRGQAPATADQRQCPSRSAAPHARPETLPQSAQQARPAPARFAFNEMRHPENVRSTNSRMATSLESDILRAQEQPQSCASSASRQHHQLPPREQIHSLGMPGNSGESPTAGASPVTTNPAAAQREPCAR